MKPTIKGIFIFVLLCFGFLFFKTLLYSQTDIPGIPLDSQPVDIAINPITDTAVAVNRGSDSISIVDLNTGTVISTIPVGRSPRGVAIDNELNLALISNNNDDTLSVIDLNSLEVIVTIPVGRHPQGVAVNQNTHTALAANHLDDTVSVIDLMTYSVTETIPVGKEPIDIAIDPEFNLALVVNDRRDRGEEDYTVSVIDLNTYEITGEVPVGKKPRAIDINPKTHIAIVANENDNTITVINLQNWDSYSISVGRHPVDVAINSLDNRALVICEEPVKGACCGDITLLLIDLNTDTIVNEYLINHMSKAVAINPYTNMAGIVDSKTNSLTLIQLPNPIPEINSINPTAVSTGGPDFTLTLTGDNFIETSIVSFNNQQFPTTFISETQIESIIPSEAIEIAGNYPVTVINPAPGGGESKAVMLTVTTGIRAIPGAFPTSGTAPLTVYFTTDGEDPSGTIEIFRWDFNGDGTWDTYDTVAKDYAHTYTNSGTYNATLFVQSSTGETATASITITVENSPPVAIANMIPSNGEVPLAVQLQGSGNDPDGSIVKYEWDAEGDGTFEYQSTTRGNTTHTYQNEGTYQAVFRVTDNNGATATASATATAISVGPPGSPTAAGTANPSSGTAPLSVNFSGTGTDPDGTIVKYEWDFNNDGIYEYSSTDSASTSYTYDEPGDYVAAFRVTDNDGLTGVDLIEITTTIQVSLSIADSDKTVNPTNSEEIGIDVSINATVPAAILIKNKAGETVRTIPVTTPAVSPERYNWAGTDDNGFIVNDGVYYAILRYEYEGEWHELDLTNTTGGTRFIPPRQSTGGTANNPALSKPFEDDFLPVHFTLYKASEVTLFVGVLRYTDTRIRTIYNRLPLPAGSRTAYWDGLDDNENIALAPPGNYLVLGIWGYTLPDNAVFVTGGRPVINNVAAEPNYFSPFSEKCDSIGNSEGVVISYTVSENVASVELRVYNLKTGSLIRSITDTNVLAGEHSFFWDGKNDNGEYADIGDYQVGLIARDAGGNESMLKYTLVRFDY